DVLSDLPPKIIQDYYCELSPLQKFLYEEFAKSTATGTLRKSLGISEDVKPEVDSKQSVAKSATHVFQALQYLRKLCNHPALVLSPKHPLYSQVVRDLASRQADLHSLDIAPKMQALKDLLNQCGIGVSDPSGAVEEEVSASHRVLIFCQHKEMIERIEQDLFQRNMPQVTFMRVDGTVEARRRQEIVTRFNSDPSIDCLLLTTHAFKLHMANTIVNQQNAGLASMNTDQLLDLFDVSPPKTTKKSKDEEEGGAKSMSKAIEGLEELWDASQYEDEYNLDNFITSLQQ
ncbi:ATP binding, partial [Coemansia sp. RSA 486]